MSDVKPPLGTFLLDDAVRHVASNGALARGALIEAEARSIQHYQHAGRPFFHFWGYQNTNDNTTLYRFARANFLEGGGQQFRARFGALPKDGASSTTQGTTVTVDGTPYVTAMPTSMETARYPQNMQAIDTTAITSFGTPVEDYSFGPNDADSPYLMSGCLYEDFTDPGDTDITVTTDGFRSGADILAVKTGAPSTVDRLQDTFRKVWRFRRPTASWSLEDPDSLYNPSADPGLELATSPNQYRYLFDQRIGNGGGTAPSVTGPGWTLPLCYSAAGLRNQIRVYVWVYACMTPIVEGDAGEGHIAVANKDSTGTMQTTFTELTNGPVITGVSPQWYPALGSFDPTSSPYFMGYCGAAPDRVLIGAKATADATVRISAITMLAFHSV